MQNQTGFRQTRQCRHLHHENDLEEYRAPPARQIIQLLACLEKHCDLERFREMFAKANLGLKTNESVVSLSVKYILTFCGDTPVRSTAVNNLLIVCSNSPRILMSPPVLSVFDEALDSTPDVIKGLLQTMIDFIQERDKQSSASSSLEILLTTRAPVLSNGISRKFWY
ncbi:hypothetical protein FOB64_001434 [Candida albicans]|uniref:Uncharacterized protein n=1 Tax=Candida albicans TaxID=5476 RepID=A0A8H6C5B6_CANAX|nr:hypothetical protein FOB64_001434 [Candida albicans]